MVCSSLSCLVLFMPLLIFLHQVVPHGARNAVLLLASIGFYAWGEDVYTLGMVASVLVSWKLAPWAEAARTDSARKAWLVLAVVLNLGALGLQRSPELTHLRSAEVDQPRIIAGDRSS